MQRIHLPRSSLLISRVVSDRFSAERKVVLCFLRKTMATSCMNQVTRVVLALVASFQRSLHPGGLTTRCRDVLNVGWVVLGSSTGLIATTYSSSSDAPFDFISFILRRLGPGLIRCIVIERSPCVRPHRHGEPHQQCYKAFHVKEPVCEDIEHLLGECDDAAFPYLGWFRPSLLPSCLTIQQSISRATHQ